MMSNTKVKEVAPTQQPKKTKDFTAEQKTKIITKSNPKIDNNIIRGYN